jgi:tetratricopeptide (TPR) repeat protein
LHSRQTNQFENVNNFIKLSSYVECLIRLGIEYEHRGLPEEAIDVYSIGIKLVENDEKLSQLHRSLGKLYYSIAKYQESVEHYENLILHNEFVEPYDYFRLSQAYRQTGQIERAFEIITFAKSKYPDFSWIAMEYSKLLHLLGNDTDALSFMLDFTERHTQDPRAHFGLCRVYFDLGDYLDALEACESAIQLNLDFNQAYLLINKIISTKLTSEDALKHSILLGDIYFERDLGKAIAGYCYALSQAGQSTQREYILERLSELGSSDCVIQN